MRVERTVLHRTVHINPGSELLLRYSYVLHDPFRVAVVNANLEIVRSSCFASKHFPRTRGYNGWTSKTVLAHYRKVDQANVVKTAISILTFERRVGYGISKECARQSPRDGQ